MTVSSDLNRKDYAGDGVTTTPFTFPYYFFADGDLTVLLTVVATGVETLQVLTTHYTVSGAGDLAGGFVSFVTAPPVGTRVTILREVPAVQESDYVENDPFLAETLERNLDRLTMIAQQLAETDNRSLRFARGDPAAAQLGSAAARANKILGFDVNGAPTMHAPDTVVAAGTSLVTATGTTNARSLADRFADLTTPQDFGAVGDGVADDTAALNAWLAAGGGFIPRANYVTSAPLTITAHNTKIVGAGIGATKITCTDDNSAGITIAGFLEGIEIGGLTLTRTPTAIAGGDGIVFLGSVGSGSLLCDLVVEKQFRGVVLGPTGYSTFRDSIVQQCQQDGVVFENTAGNGALQWYLSSVLSQMNAGRGFYVLSLAGPTSVALGTWDRIATFANGGVGVAIVGLAGVPVHGFRLNNSFIGEDGNHEIFLGTFGGMHRIMNSFVEISGSRTTGPSLATPASNTGDGIHITANNLEVEIIGCKIEGNSLNGIRTSASVRTIIVGNDITNNGRALTAGERDGIKFVAGQALITGNRIGNRSGTQQDRGILLNVDAATIVGNDLSGNNSSAAVFTVSPPVLSNIFANQGLTVQNNTADLTRDGVKVLGTRRTGWGAPTGTATRTTFATGAVTLVQLAERVKALIDDMTTHGAIGP